MAEAAAHGTSMGGDEGEKEGAREEERVTLPGLCNW
jgi:hypothetical protein